MVSEALRQGENSICLAVDNAWDFGDHKSIGLPRRVEAGRVGKSLRFLTSKKRIEQFYHDFSSRFRPFTLFGSGDFHHLTAVLVRQFSDPFVIVSFDNHPDWDIRPPYWCCGAWINRALENPLVEKIVVWGCGSFECLFPGRLLGNSAACKSGRLRVVPWAKKGRRYPSWLQSMTGATWREQFMNFVEAIGASNVYVTVDMDCFIKEDAVTNWENGLYSVEEIVWAINLLRSKANMIGGDLCGAFSHPRYTSWFQQLASRFDHPRERVLSGEQVQLINRRAFWRIWPALIGAK